MNSFATFAIYGGLFLALIGVVASWLFRQSGAPLALKLAVPALIVILACVTPEKVSALLGYPVFVPFSSLPKQAELVAFVPNDEEHLVDLWLKVGPSAPRAYEVVMTGGLKQTLRDAGEKLAHGERVGVRKGKTHTGVTDIETPEAPYVLSDDIFSLPRKSAD